MPLNVITGKPDGRYVIYRDLEMFGLLYAHPLLHSNMSPISPCRADKTRSSAHLSFLQNWATPEARPLQR
jgi:hypothetical protein